jgi:alpha-beta hydrolase superfamily lysophospholipase
MDFFQTTDRLSLHIKTLPAAEPKASVVFVHGVGEHIGRYDAAFAAFASHGYSCFGFDQRGFGRSEGERGHVEAFSDYAEDLAKFIAAIVSKAKGRPVFLFGHSMGSLVVLSYALQYAPPVQGLIIFSCPLKLAYWHANRSGFIADALIGIAPRLKVPNLIDIRELSNDPSVIKAFKHDPLRVNKVSVSWLREFKRARENILLNAHRILIPTLISHGSADRITDAAGSTMLYERLGGVDKSLTVYAGLKHELLNHRPADRIEVLKHTLQWLDERC